DVQDALGSRGGGAPGLLDHERQRMALVENAQLPARAPLRRTRRVEVDASLQEKPVHVADHRSAVTGRVNLSRRAVRSLQVLDEGPNLGRPRVGTALIDGIAVAALGHA